MVLEKTPESPLDCKEIQLVHPKDQSWVFTGKTDVEAETLILWPPDEKGWLIWKDPDAGKDWRQEEKGTTEDKMLGWHHWLNGHELAAEQQRIWISVMTTLLHSLKNVKNYFFWINFKHREKLHN